MTLVNQDTVLEYAKTMGEFSTIQMAYRAYGDLTNNHLSATHRMLMRLLKWGFIEKLPRRKDEYNTQPQTYWRAAP